MYLTAWIARSLTSHSIPRNDDAVDVTTLNRHYCETNRNTPRHRERGAVIISLPTVIARRRSRRGYPCTKQPGLPRHSMPRNDDAEGALLPDVVMMKPTVIPPTSSRSGAVIISLPTVIGMKPQRRPLRRLRERRYS